jgi:hypothetical protein
MKKRFIIALKGGTAAQDSAFTEFIKKAGVGWWHWIPSVWLVADTRGAWSAAELRNKLREYYPGVHSLVIELRPDDDTWSGFGPAREERNMFNWLKQNWSK